MVWITGASSGIGEGLAKSLTRYGVRVAISARRVEELERVQRECLGTIFIKSFKIFPIYFEELNFCF